MLKFFISTINIIRINGKQYIFGNNIQNIKTCNRIQKYRKLSRRNLLQQCQQYISENNSQNIKICKKYRKLSRRNLLQQC